MDFAFPVWSLRNLSDASLLESIQQRRTKQMSGLTDLSYGDRLAMVNLHFVKSRVLRLDLTAATYSMD